MSATSLRDPSLLRESAPEKWAILIESTSPEEGRYEGRAEEPSQPWYEGYP